MFYYQVEIWFGGSELCDVIFQGVLLFVTKCDMGEGDQKSAKIA
jgi:hypothetical protein